MTEKLESAGVKPGKLINNFVDANRRVPMHVHQSQSSQTFISANLFYSFHSTEWPFIRAAS